MNSTIYANISPDKTALIKAGWKSTPAKIYLDIYGVQATHQ